MPSVEKILAQVLRGTADANIAFADLCRLLHQMGFVQRTKGSHHVFRREGVRELIVLQEDGKHAKPYQVRQVRSIIARYGLAELI